MKRFSAFVLSALLLCLLMTATLSAPAGAVETVEIHVDNRRKPYEHVAFYYVYGKHIEWWQGGAKFLFKPGTPEYEVIEEFMLALPGELGVEVLVGELHLVEGYVRARYIFDGIIQFKGYMFIDNEGVMIVEWVYGVGLNVTIYSKAAVNLTASEVEGYGFAGWERRIIGYGEVCDPLLGCRRQPVFDSTPTAEVPIGSEVLVVPVEGVILEESYRGYTHYLGGGPNLDIADVSKSVKAGMIFWDREPDYWFVYDAQGLAEVWKIDNWFNQAVLIWPIPHEVKVAPARS